MVLALAITFADVQWQRPLALWSLVLPLVVLLVARRRARPEPVAVGTFAIWRRIGGGAEGVLRRRRLPLWALLLALSLAAGALALARPRRARAAPPRRWTVVVDRSPSMFLEHTDASGRPTGAGSRLAAASRALADWLASGGEDVELEWLDPGVPHASAARGDFPSEWLDPPRFATESPEWALFDRPGVVWLTDRRVRPAPAHAVLVASGGGPVPGPVGSVGTTRLDWDGTVVREVEGAIPRRAVAVDAALPALLRAFVATWAEERGLELSAGPGPRVALEVRAAGAGEVRAVRAGRDGWSAGGRAARAPVESEGRALAVWLTARGGASPLVTHAAGLVLISLVDIEAPRGDPAAFAVSWAALLDDACLAAPGVVSIDERVAAGDAIVQPPESSDEGGPVGELPAMPLDTALAIAAAALALLASACGTLRPLGAVAQRVGRSRR